jgi:hypothetical protein
MPSALVLNHDGEVSELPLARVDPARLYGSSKRVVADEDGEACSSGYLSADGTTLVPAGGYTRAYVDVAGSTVARSDLLAVDAAGDVLDQLPSTLGHEHELFGPVAPSRVLDHVTTSVYLLAAEQIGAKLSARLDAGEIFEAEFRYAASTSTNTLFLLRNHQGTFGLVCQPLDLAFVQPDTLQQHEDEEDEDESDLDQDLDFSF